MNKFFAIAPVNADPFIVTWDLGRRCNYDCSYCPSHRHDNFSPHADLSKLKKTADFLFEYLNVIAKHRINKDFHISFTGGEPTVNPNFIEFSKHIKNSFSKYRSQFNIRLDLTSNGAMSTKIAEEIIDNFDFITISYHAEASAILKNTVKERILQFHKSKIALKVNVMFHAEHFEECKELCGWLVENNIKFIPRLIGEDPSSPFSQAHKYTEEQKQWLKDYWKIEITTDHRPCCGGRTFSVCSKDENVETKIIKDRNFLGWHCSVNWYFLHIEQQTESIYHHQTCQANFDGVKGPIGTLDQWPEVISNLEQKLTEKTMPIIVCPNLLCGCGLCTPKSKNRQDLFKSLPAVVKNVDVFNVD